jgi:hypothetical protein
LRPGGTRTRSNAFHLDRFAVMLVDIRLAIGDDDHLVAAQLGMQQRTQALRVPGRFELERAPVLVLEVVQALAQVGRERFQLGHRTRHRPDQAFASQQRTGALHPPAPAQLRHRDRDQRNRGT